MVDEEPISDRDEVFARFNYQAFNWEGYIDEWEELWKKANPEFPIRVKKLD